MKTNLHTQKPAATALEFSRSVRPTVLWMGLLALFVFVITSPVSAQTVSNKNSVFDSELNKVMSDEESFVRELIERNVLVEVASLDFSALSNSSWKEIRNEQIRDVRSGNEEEWITAARNIIFLNKHYPDKVNFRRATGPLLEIFIHDRNERHRILALAALHSIGKSDAMAYLAEYVKTERSPNVKRLTVAAINDLYAER